MIETVDSLKLMKEIDRQGAKCGRVIDILLELHLAQEDTKSGMTPSDCLALLDGGEWREMRNIRIRGIMMMASNTDDTEEIRREFLLARDFFNAVKAKHFANDTAFDTKSYGMSHDYLLAQQCGSNHVRVGSRIFG